MRIMQVNVVYPKGSTGKIVKDIHKQLLENNHESIVCYGRGDNVSEIKAYKIAPEFIMKLQSLRAKITGYAYAGCYYSTYNLMNLIKNERPDVVHLHCINGYMVNIFKLMEYLKRNNIPTVLTLHAEFMYTAGCGHALDCGKWKIGCGNCPQKGAGRPASKIFDRSTEEWKLMYRAFDGFNKIIVTSVSSWLHDRAKQSPFFLDKTMKVVLNGIDTNNIFKPTGFTELKKRYRLQDEKIILHVTANFKDPIKGGKHVIEIAERLKDERIKIFIVGFSGDDSKLPSNITAITKVGDQRELAAFYSMADLTLLTSVKETFSMICAESLACGTPIVGFKAGAPEAISIKRYSEFVNQGDMDALEYSIRKWINRKQELGEDIYNEARRKYAKERMYEEYLYIYRGLIQ